MAVCFSFNSHWPAGWAVGTPENGCQWDRCWPFARLVCLKCLCSPRTGCTGGILTCQQENSHVCSWLLHSATRRSCCQQCVLFLKHCYCQWNWAIVTTMKFTFFLLWWINMSAVQPVNLVWNYLRKSTSNAYVYIFFPPLELQNKVDQLLPKIGDNNKIKISEFDIILRHLVQSCCSLSFFVVNHTLPSLLWCAPVLKVMTLQSQVAHLQRRVSDLQKMQSNQVTRKHL